MNAPAAPGHDDLRRVVEAFFSDRVLSWILSSEEPAARLAARAGVLGEPESDPDIQILRHASIATRVVQDLVDTLPGPGREAYERRDSVRFLPNALLLLHDLGVRRGDFPRVDEALEQLLTRRDRRGRFIGPTPALEPAPSASAALCDAHATLEAALRYGLRDDPRVERALEQALLDLRRSSFGRAWCCEGRSRLDLLRRRECDVCPHATVRALRALACLPPQERPSLADDAARALLAIWQLRAAARPSGFGHGYQFATTKWPHLWYDALAVVEAVSPYLAVWREQGAAEEDRSALFEVAAVFIAANADGQGRIVPRRVAPGFRDVSFGRKSEPSPLATAIARRALNTMAEFADEIARTDGATLDASARSAPKTGFMCATLNAPADVPATSVVARLLQRQHIGTPWVQTTPETFIADIVAFPAIDPRAPFLALVDRLGARALEQLCAALYERRTLVLFRCMRGGLHVVRADMLPVFAQATGRAVRHHSARFLGSRGITARHYEVLAERVLAALEAGPLTVEELRIRLRPHADLSAVVTHMCNEGLLVRDLPQDGPLGRKTRFARLDSVLPGVRLDSLSEEAATRDLVRAYVRAYAPVTVADIAWWTGIGPRRTARVLEELSDELAYVRVTGLDDTALVHLADIDELESSAIAGRPVTALAPAGDPLLSSRRQRGLLVPDDVRTIVFDRSGRPAPTIVIDGVVRGVWDLTASGGVLLHSSAPLSDGELKAVEKRAMLLAMTFGARTELTWIPSAPSLAEARLSRLLHPLSMHSPAARAQE